MAVFVDGGIHAREWIASAAVLHLIWKMTTGANSDPLVNWMLDNADWCFCVDVIIRYCLLQVHST